MSYPQQQYQEAVVNKIEFLKIIDSWCLHFICEVGFCNFKHKVMIIKKSRNKRFFGFFFRKVIPFSNTPAPQVLVARSAAQTC